MTDYTGFEGPNFVVLSKAEPRKGKPYWNKNPTVNTLLTIYFNYLSLCGCRWYSAALNTQKESDMNDKIWDIVINEYGGGSQSSVARRLGVSRQAVNKARRGDRDVPVLWASKIHRDTGGKVRADVMRPDIFLGICN